MSDQKLRATSWWEQYRQSVQAGTTHEAELLFRSPAPAPGGHERREHIFETIETVTERGILDGYDMTVLGQELCLCHTCVHTPLGTRLLHKLAVLKDWGTESASPESFDEREVDSSITGEQYRVLIPPEICLSVTVDSSVEGVFPATIDGTSYGIEALLDALAVETERQEASPIDS